MKKNTSNHRKLKRKPTWIRTLLTTIIVMAGMQATQAQITYCLPNSVDCSYGDEITQVTLQTLSNPSTCGTGYNDFTASVPAATLTPGQTYPIDITVGIGQGDLYLALWIDYDQNGTFDASEYVMLGQVMYTGTSNVLTGSIPVPGTALPGNTRMRVGVAFFFPLQAGDACTSSTNFSEMEDYLIHMNALTPCTGTPAAGSATATAVSVCRDSPFDLNLNGSIVGQSGITYQWQASLNGGSWTNIGASQTSALYTVNSQTVSAQYRCVVTCSASVTSSTSAPVTVNQNNFTTCYCTPPTSFGGCFSDDVILEVDLHTLNNPSTCTFGGYTDYTGAVPATTLTTGQTYSINVQVGAGTTMPSSGYEYVSYWIDYDHSGTFDASEYDYVGSGNSTILTSNLTVPANALPGETHMRVNTKFGHVISDAAQPNEACLSIYLGEIEDYVIFIACTTPTLTTFISTPVCSGQNLTLGAGGVSTYTWSSGATTPSITVSAPMVITPTPLSYTVTGMDACGTSIAATLTLQVNPMPLVTAIASSTVICVDDHATITLTTGGATSYTWTAGSPTGTTIATTTSTTVTPTVSTTYFVHGVSGSTQCASTASVAILVSPCTGIETWDDSQLIYVYPNPTEGILTISLPELSRKGQVWIEVYDAFGKQVMYENLSLTQTQISTDQLKQGVYFYNVYNAGTLVKRDKLMKQ